ncbi:unnamed protein product [Urochloa humidicola]
MSLRPSERAELRRSTFKPSADLDERRRRRVGFTVEIRKSSRDSALQKTRRAAAALEAAPQAQAQHPSRVAETKLAEGLYSGDSSVQVGAVREFRKLLSIENPPIEEVVSSGLVPGFIQLLAREDFPEIQVKPALQVLRQLIHSQDDEVLSHACRALSYLSDGGIDNIQAVIESGACPQLVELLNHSSPSVLIPLLHVIGNIVSTDDVQIQCIIDLQALPYLLNLLMTNQNKGLKPEVCRIISNIMAGNKEQIQSVINGNMVGPLVHLMQTAEFCVRYEAAWAIANAASGGTHDQIKYLVSQGCIKAFCDLLTYSDTSILMVCLEGLDNTLKVGEAEKSPWDCNVNMYAQMIEDAGWLDKIENLQNHDNSRIVEQAACLLESYWLNEDKAMPMLWDDPMSWLVEDRALDFGFFAPQGDCDFG